VTAQNEMVTGEVNLQISELYDPSDFIKQGVSTQYKTTLLQTGGAIHVSFKYKGRELKFKEGTTFQIAFPKNKNDKKSVMNLYSGSIVDGYVRWEEKIAEQENTWNKTFFSENLNIQEYYLFSSNITSWLNCDAELDPNKLATVSLDLDTIPAAKILLMFPRIKGICAPVESSGGSLIFNEVAVDLPGI